MKISILFLALFAYFVNASEERMIDSYNAANTDLATDAPATDAPETTMDPLTGWTRIGTCYYLLTSTAETWNDADSACKAAISGGRLAVVGFNQASAARSALINAAGAASTTFWIGATGEVDDSAGIDNPTFITPLFGADPTGGSADFVAELADSSAEDSDVCGRVSATDTDKLRFEDCATREFRSMCEYCG